MKLFKNTQSPLITSPTNFPSGLAVKTEKATYWIKDGKRFKAISKRAAESWGFVTVNASESALINFKIAGKLGFRDGTLIKDISNGKLYLISQNKKRHIVDPDVFDYYGLDKSSIIEVSKTDAEMHDEGEELCLPR
mgnify:CR=1 FL=1|jgi:hypothetical protein